MSNDEDQADEVCSLQSIYNEEEFHCTTEEDGLRVGNFFAYINLPTGFPIIYTTYHDGKSKKVVIPIEHLPPIELSFKLPKTYPADAIPEFMLSCPWLTATKLQKLCGKFEALWDEWKGSAILYTWTNFLKEEALEWLGLKDQLDISRRYLMDLRRSGKAVETRGNKTPHKMKPRKIPGERPPLDTRIIIKQLNFPLHEYLEYYNDDRSKTTFLRNFYLCAICFQETAGTHCLQFAPCRHIYCKQCMNQYFTIRINDGMVSSMPCPYEKCSSEANPQQVKDVVGMALFNKYDSLLLSVTLDKMDDIYYCPRISCGTPVMKEVDEKMAVCSACRYVFCVFCKKAYHGVEFCNVKSAEMRKVIAEYQEGDADIKSRLEKRYGITLINRHINEMLSDDWVQANSKNCPSCSTSIEKSDGCNKMSCGKCQAYFCWLCLDLLDKTRPYDHFTDANSRCRNQLFLDENMEVDADDDEYDDEDDYELVQVVEEVLLQAFA